MKYLVEVVTGSGATDRREIEAKSAREAEDQARKRGLFPIRVVEREEAASAARINVERQPSALDRFFNISAQDRILFTQKLATFLRAGLPILPAVEILRDQSPKGPLKSRLSVMARDIAAGEPLASSLDKFPKDFSMFYVSSVKAGEAGGTLPEVLERLGNYLDKIRQRKKKAVTAALYPSILLVAIIGVIFIVSLKYIPMVEKFLSSLRVPLPALTGVVLDANKFFLEYWYWFLVFPIFVALGYKMVLMRIQASRRFMHRTWLKMPMLGTLIKQTNYSWMFRTFGMLSYSGVPVLNALKVTSDVISNDVIRAEVERIRDEVSRGEPIARTMEKGGLFDRFAVTMLDVGERSGELDAMMNRVADFYDQELDEFYVRMESILPAVLTLFMAGLVGVVVVALYLPILTIMETLADKKGGF